MKGRRWTAAFGAPACGLLFLLPVQAAEVREKTYALESAGTKTRLSGQTARKRLFGNTRSWCRDRR